VVSPVGVGFQEPESLADRARSDKLGPGPDVSTMGQGVEFLGRVRPVAFPGFVLYPVDT